jgi:uncharacterized protein YjeT (DUF2065 family)
VGKRVEDNRPEPRRRDAAIVFVLAGVLIMFGAWLVVAPDDWVRPADAWREANSPDEARVFGVILMSPGVFLLAYGLFMLRAIFRRGDREASPGERFD